MTEKTKRQSGYLVKIEAFVPADLSHTETLRMVQEHADKARQSFGVQDVKVSITSTRR